MNNCQHIAPCGQPESGRRTLNISRSCTENSCHCPKCGLLESSRTRRLAELDKCAPTAQPGTSERARERDSETERTTQKRHKEIETAREERGRGIHSRRMGGQGFGPWPGREGPQPPARCMARPLQQHVAWPSDAELLAQKWYSRWRNVPGAEVNSVGGGRRATAVAVSHTE